MAESLFATLAGRPGHRRLPSVLMRSGTSRGLFLHRRDMPASESEWGPILIAAMGSSNNDPRQLEGVGGATSTTSKVVVVSPSARPDIDVEYTFVQVAVGAEVVDLSGNCGNMASGIAAFALDEGLVKANPGDSEILVRIFNTNTQATLVETVQVDPETGLFLEEGDYRIPGVKAPGSQIKVKFLSPGGSMTGTTFPTGQRRQVVHVTCNQGQFDVSATIIDVSNPFVFVDASTLPASYHNAPSPNSEEALAIIEAIRRQASLLSGVAPDEDKASKQRGTPKISLLYPADNSVSPPSPRSQNDKSPVKAPLADIRVLSYSMGKTHPSFQLTGAVCLGAAVCLDGTVAADLATPQYRALPPTPPSVSPERGEHHAKTPTFTSRPKSREVVIQHPSGTMDVEVELAENGDEAAGVTVSRTAKRVFEGFIRV